jgi:Zn-dependent metalloprotease
VNAGSEDPASIGMEPRGFSPRGNDMTFLAFLFALIAQAQAPANGRSIIATPESIKPGESNGAALQELRLWNENVEDWTQAGELRRVSLENDPVLPGRRFERLIQVYRGVPVFGGDVVRELNRFNQTDFILGTYYPDISIDPVPAIAADRAAALLSAAGGGTLGPDAPPLALTVLPTAAGYILTWTARVYSSRTGRIDRVFIDARSGDVVYRYDDNVEIHRPASNLIHANESGALSEAFADIMSGGVRAPDGPDHYSLRSKGPSDNGGIHSNSNIVHHMFALAIEGGINRVSGVAVTGVGLANRDQIENVFSRAFTHLPANATFLVARAASIQAARDLHGIGSRAERAIIAAWTAVGVGPGR